MVELKETGPVLTGSSAREPGRLFRNTSGKPWTMVNTLLNQVAALNIILHQQRYIRALGHDQLIDPLIDFEPHKHPTRAINHVLHFDYSAPLTLTRAVHYQNEVWYKGKFALKKMKLIKRERARGVSIG